MSAVVLAIDLGSTFFKAAVFNADLETLGRGSCAIQYLRDGDGLAAIEVRGAEQALRDVIGAALAESRTAASDICALAITSQAQTFTVCNSTGDAKIPFISWQDLRPHRLNLPAWPDFPSHSGFCELLPGLLVSHLLLLQDERCGRAIQRGDRILPLPSYFVYKLTGQAIVDSNLAAMTGVYSLVTNSWWSDALDRCHLEESNLPAVAPLGASAGVTTGSASEWGLAAGIPVVLAGNDQTAGAWGADIGRNRAVLITLGSAQVAYRALSSLPEPRAGCLRGLFGDGLFYQLAADDAGGTVIDWAEKLLAGGNSDESFFAAAATSPPGCEGLVFEADLNALRAAWQGIGPHHTTAHFCRSVVESLVKRMVGMVNRLCPGAADEQVLVAGGGSRYSLWVEMLSEALGRPITVTTASPLLGAAKMGLRGVPLPRPASRTRAL